MNFKHKYVKIYTSCFTKLGSPQQSLYTLVEKSFLKPHLPGSRSEIYSVIPESDPQLHFPYAVSQTVSQHEVERPLQKSFVHDKQEVKQPML